MIDIAQDFLDALGRPAVYRATPDAEPVATTVIFKEGAAEVRAGRSQLVMFGAEATVARSLGVIRYSHIEIDGSIYEIGEMLRSPTPGLLDLGLTRLAGGQVTEDCYGAAADAIEALGRPVLIDGRPVFAQVSQWGEKEETRYGQIIETVRTVLSVRFGDVVDVLPGASATVDDEDYRIRAILPDARGLARVVLE